MQAARLRAELITRYGEDGAFPPSRTLARAGLDLPGRKSEYLRAVAEAAVDGLLDGAALRAVNLGEAVARVQQVKGLGPFAAELVVVRGANALDALPRHERRLDAEIADRYGPGHTLDQISQAWRPYRTRAAAWGSLAERLGVTLHHRIRRAVWDYDLPTTRRPAYVVHGNAPMLHGHSEHLLAQRYIS